jgi:malate dehydrogenase
MTDAVKVAVTNGGGRVARALVPRIAAGEMFGPGRRVVLSLVGGHGDIHPPVHTDGGHSLLDDVRFETDPHRALEGADWVILLDETHAKPDGVVPRDWIDAKTFVGWGRAINASAPNARILVASYPCNIHAMIARAHAQDVPPWHWFALMRHVEDMAAELVASRAGVPRASVSHLAVFGCSGPLAFVDLHHARIDGHPAPASITGADWAHGPFAAELKARLYEFINGHLPASAFAVAVAATIHGLTTPTPFHDWISVSCESNGSYEIPRGLMCGRPVRTEDGLTHEIVGGLYLDGHGHRRIAENVARIEFEAVEMNV